MNHLRWTAPWIAVVLVAALSLGSMAAKPPYAINVVLSKTGSGAFLGTHETAAIAVLEKVVNARRDQRPAGPLHVQDDQTTQTVAVQLKNGLIAKRVPVVIGSSLASSKLSKGQTRIPKWERSTS